MASKEPARPNVVFILSDDQGYWALGCAGNPEIRTPNLDRLAARGVRFENFFCTSPVCSPARATLLTGLMPSQHGVHDWIRGGNIAGENGREAIDYLVGLKGYPEILAENGYTCALSGKWHLGDSMSPKMGFNHWYAHPRGGGVYYGAQMIRDGRFETVPGYLTEAIAQDALEFLDTQLSGNTPFYLSLHFTAPHSPWLDQHPSDIVALYKDCAFESCPQQPQHPGATFQEVQFSLSTAGRKTEQVPVREFLKGYFAAVTAMDAQIGRVVERLERAGLLENTLIVFLSDNGFNCGHHGIWGKGNGTFPANMYDTSVKVPAIFCQPGRLPQGQVCQALVSGYDFLPSLLDLVGLAEFTPANLPGRSFASLMLGGSDADWERVVVYDEYGPTRMIRTRDWKYVHRYPYGPNELYNLQRDPEEQFNLLGEERVLWNDNPPKEQVVRILKADLDNWFAAFVDPRRDGVREAVTGRGQLNLAGPAGKGFRAFHEREAVFYR